jgi:predicted ATPase
MSTVEGSAGRMTSTKEEILAAVGEDIGVLTFVIPALKEVVGQQSHHVMKGSEAQD